MKLEPLKSSKLEKFKSSEIQDSFRIVGGAPQATTYHSNDGTSGCDTIDWETDDGLHYQKCDYSRNVCPPSV